MQVMNVMAPMSIIQKDYPGAFDMLKSSFALAKHMNDLPTQLAALGSVHDLYTQCVNTSYHTAVDRAALHVDKDSFAPLVVGVIIEYAP